MNLTVSCQCTWMRTPLPTTQTKLMLKIILKSWWAWSIKHLTREESRRVHKSAPNSTKPNTEREWSPSTQDLLTITNTTKTRTSPSFWVTEKSKTLRIALTVTQMSNGRRKCSKVQKIRRYCKSWWPSRVKSISWKPCKLITFLLKSKKTNSRKY